MLRDDLVRYLDDLLDIHAVADYGPQGLQVEGRVGVERIVGMVDAAPPCVAAALEQEADLLLVHHGIFWGPTQRLAGPFGRHVRHIVESGLNLYAAHLALDGHDRFGNNAVLAERLGLRVDDWWGEVKGRPIAVRCEAEPDTSFDALLATFEAQVGPPKLVQHAGPARVRRVGICSGGSGAMIAEAAAAGCDTFVTGETSHAHFHDAATYGLNVIWAGHYQSETVGVMALGEHLAERFGLDFAFIDLPTGV